jgi:hypothetical protein
MWRSQNRTIKTTLRSARSSALKNNLTGPTLLEMSGYATNRDLAHGPRLTVAVGTTIADRPPRRSVRALLRIRLLLWMNGGETCCWPHTVQSLGHALPALCRTHVGWNDVLLSLCPSLPGLRRRHAALRCSAGSLVLRHSPTSPVRSCPPCGLWPSRTGLGRLTKTCRRSPGSRACCFSACAGS